MNSTSGATFLLTQFRDFYSEVVHLKRVVATSAWIAPAAQIADMTTARTRAVTAVWQRLLTLLEQQELTVGRRGGTFSAMFYKEAQYVMAALADETFLHLDWDGKADWQTHLLEARLFDSQSAGEVLFQKIERLLHSGDPVYTDLASVYLTALGLGFQGKFRGSDDGGQLADYRRRLYAFIAHGEPELLHAIQPLFPAAYAHTLGAGKAHRFPTSRRWWVLLACTVLLLGGISHVLWVRLSADLHQTITPILRTK
jgi:type VI secretion system protein ImpK